MCKSTRCVMALTLILTSLVGVIGMSADAPMTRATIFAVINSVDPTGLVTDAPRTMKFTARVSFAGVSGESHTLNLKLAVLDADAKVLATANQTWTVISGEQGCLKCPVTCKTPKCLDPGAYFVIASLTDQKASEQPVVVDAKSFAVILTE